MRACKHFKNWSEEFVTLECWFYGNRTHCCHHEEHEYDLCQWQGKPKEINSSSISEPWITEGKVPLGKPLGGS
jgi:hypothetical protein